MATYKISAIPFEGYEGFSRAGKRWTSTPRTITVRTPAAGEELGEDEVTPEQLEQLKREPRIKIDGFVRDTPESQDEVEKVRLRAEMMKAVSEPIPPDPSLSRKGDKTAPKP